MKYFKNVGTLEELRREYKRFVKENHPDNGGSVEAIKNINVEYEQLFKVLKNNDKNGKTEHTKYNMAEDKMLRNVINNIINFNINIEICGSWIWVSGNTYGCKTELKQNGFHWASKKKMWYWHNPEEQVRGNGKATMDDIRSKYGSHIMKESARKIYIA